VKRQRKHAPLLDPAFVWHPASSHGDSTAFRERQRERMKRAQAKPAANVAPITQRKGAA
jgi:hypothetical protein